MDGVKAPLAELRQRHAFLADLFRQLKMSGHLEAACAAFETADRVFAEAQIERQQMNSRA